MKKIILLTISLVLSSACLMAQKTVYVIDNVTIEDFDGSQLKGKNIKDYQISTTGKGREAITVHAITTTRSVFSFSGDFPKIHIDSISTLEDLKLKYHFLADSIRIDTLKNYGFHINNLPQGILYIIDGERADASAFRSLSASQINIVRTLGRKESLERYGSFQPTIVVETKKDITSEKGIKTMMKKIPGAKVEKDGTVTVNGKPVKKITINGITYKL